VTVAMLLLYQSAVNCSSRDAQHNFSTKWISVRIVIFRA